MAVGDPYLILGNIPAESSVDITLTSRVKITGMAINSRSADVQLYLSTNGVDFYNIGVIGLHNFGVCNTGTTNIHGNTSSAMFLPSGTVIRLKNFNTSSSRDYMINGINY